VKRLLLAVLVALAVPPVAAAKPNAVSWCGTDEVTQNRVPDLDAAARQQIRFVYAVPSDAPDNFFAVASGIASDAAWIEQWWQAQDATRAPRFDRYGFPGCTTTGGALDIGFVRLPNRSAVYTLEPTPSIRLDRDLRNAFPDTQKTVVYFDAPIATATVCGETDYLADDAGGGHGIVYVFMQSCSIGAPGAGETAEIAAHELLHNLGAVPEGAPHECPDSSAHACDSTVDVMYPFLGTDSTLDEVQLDIGRDDYYGHAGPQWDVQDSGWLSHLPQFPLTLAVRGEGTLATRAATATLPCAEGCTTIALDNGERVAITAHPSAGWLFGSWSGACAGQGPSCALAVDGATTATATFVKARTTVGVTMTGRGRVTSAPAGVSCPGACTAAFAGASVRLRSTPAQGWVFTGWSGACHGSTTCVARGNARVQARFTRR
jgi:Divergent InlB B-repeat domain